MSDKWQEQIDAEFKAMSAVRRLNPEAHCTYHYPTVDAGGYRVHEWGKPISGFHQNKLDACNEAIKILRRLKRSK